MSVAVRIVLRYLAAFLVAKGVLLPADGALFATDPEVVQAVEFALGVAIGAVAETWYWLAKRLGWRT